MSPWKALYTDHTLLREDQQSFGSDIRKRLKELVKRKHGDHGLPSKFHYKKNNDLLDYRISGGVAPLKNVTTLVDVKLTILATICRRKNHLHRFTVMLEGTTPKEHDSWVIAVHLENNAGREPDRRGRGACGHAVYHCHVGPTLDAEPKVRVPLPAVPPAHILDWVLTQVIPTWEPSPWSANPDQ